MSDTEKNTDLTTQDSHQPAPSPLSTQSTTKGKGKTKVTTMDSHQPAPPAGETLTTMDSHQPAPPADGGA